MIRSSPIAANRPSTIHPLLPRVAHRLVAGIQREPERGGIAALGLATGAHGRHPLGDLVGLQEDEVQLVRELGSRTQR